MSHKSQKKDEVQADLTESPSHRDEEYAQFQLLLTLWREITHLLENVADLDEGMPQILKSIANTLGCDLGAFWEVKEKEDKFLCKFTWESNRLGNRDFQETSVSGHFSLNRGFPGKVYREKKPVWFANFENQEEFPRAKVAKSAGLRSAIGFPIKVGEEVYGVMEFFSVNVIPPQAYVMKLIGTLGSQIGQVMKRTKALEALQHSEARKTSIVETALDCIISMDHEGRIIEFNPAAERTFGFDRSEVIGKLMSDTIIPHRFRQTHQEGLKRYLSTGIGTLIGKRIEVVAIRSDNTEFPAELAITAVVGIGAPIFIGYLRDISQRVNTEKLIRTSEEQFRKIFMDAPLGMALVNNQHKFLKVNKILCEILKYTEEEFLNLTFLDLVHPDDQESHHKLLNQLWNERIPNVQIECRYFSKLKEVVWVSLTATLIYNQDGKPSYGLKMVHDIRERKRIEQQLIVANEAAVKATQAKSQFLAHVSHEIRTPMNAIIGMIDILLDTKLTKKQGKYAQVTKRSATSLLTLLNDLLDLSKVESGKFSLEIIDFDLKELLEDAREVLAQSAKKKKLKYHFFVESNVPSFVKGDPFRIRQVILNLISNACKFTSEGSINVRVSAESEDENIILKCEVSDTGIGIPEDFQNRLFRNFTQVDSTTTRKYGGTGLGLAISKQLIKMMKGEIGLSSTVGKGSTFWFTVLTEKSTARPATIVQLKKVKKVNRRTKNAVLLVEDDDVCKEVAEVILKKNGYRVKTVGRGDEAISELRNSKYDLVLMDCQLPIMDGYAATSMIRKKELKSGKNIPVIAMTANAGKDEREKCLRAGMNDYLIKSINPEILVKLIQKWIGGSQGNHTNNLSHSTPEDSSLPPKVIDFSIFEKLRNFDKLNENGLITGVIDIFLRIAPERIQKMKVAVSNGDALCIAKEVHAFKSNCAYVGAVGMLETCERLESLVSQGQLETTDQLVQSLAVDFQAVKLELEKHKKKVA